MLGYTEVDTLSPDSLKNPLDNADAYSRMVSMRKTKLHIWVLHEHGDDYHGSRVAGAFKRLRDCWKTRQMLESGPSCEECGFRYYYTQELVELR